VSGNGGEYDVNSGGGGGFCVRSGEDGGWGVISGKGGAFGVNKAGGEGFCVGSEGGGWFEFDEASLGGGGEQIVGHVTHSLMHNKPLEGSSTLSSISNVLFANKTNNMNAILVVHANQLFVMNPRFLLWPIWIMEEYRLCLGKQGMCVHTARWIVRYIISFGQVII